MPIVGGRAGDDPRRLRGCALGQRAKAVVRDAITTARYAFLDEPRAVPTGQVLQDNEGAIRLRATVYVLDLEHEKAPDSDVTDRALAGPRAASLSPRAVLHRGVG